MAKATIGLDLTRHDGEATALPEKLTAGRDAGKDTEEIMFATCYIAIRWDMEIGNGMLVTKFGIRVVI